MDPQESLSAVRWGSAQAYLSSLALMITSMLMLDGCQVIEGIFKAGVWVGVLAVVGVLALIGGVVALVHK